MDSLNRFTVMHKPTILDSHKPLGDYADAPDVSGMLLYDERPDRDIYVSSDLRDELKRAEAHGGFNDSLLFHATNSLALNGLAKHRAICSASYLIEQGEAIQTGEILTESGKYYRNRGGLSEVYVSRNATSTTYCYADGEPDRYPTIFGIGGKLANELMNNSFGTGYEIPVPGKIGLDNVRSVIVPVGNISEMQDWASENCEDSLVLSMEAAMILGRLGLRA